MERNASTSQPFFAKLSANGRLLIPAGMRQELGLNMGDTVVMEIVDGVLHLESHRTRIGKIQDEVRQLAGPGRSLVDELIAERREEARRETEEAAQAAARERLESNVA